jgi:sugar fermentation stimulation protein A
MPCSRGASRRRPCTTASLPDKGSYLLLIHLKAKASIEAGALGRLRLNAGHYVYVGSAMGGLRARISRHLRRAGRRGAAKHWHLDYLLEKVNRRSVRGLPIPGVRSLECTLAREVARLADGEVAGFGCTDCRCRSHLCYFRGNPLAREGFRTLLHRCLSVPGAILREGSAGPPPVCCG